MKITRKNLLAIGVVSALALSAGNAHALSFGDEGTSVFSMLKSDSSEKTKKDASLEIVSDSWDGVENRFGKIFKQKEKQENAGFWFSKSDYQEDIDELYAQVFEMITDEGIEDLKERLLKNDENLKDENQRLTELKKKQSLAYEPAEKASYDLKIAKQNAKIKNIKANKQSLIREVQFRLSEFGVDVTDDQVEALLVKVNANDILSMSTTFPVIAKFATHLGEITQNTGEDLVSAKKYYGMYVLLLELQLFIQDQYIDRLENEFIPKIDQLKDRSVELISNTKDLMRKSSKKPREIFANNLESQEFTLKAINLYKSQLISDLAKVKKAKAKLSEDYKVAMNTYETVDLSFNVSALINANSNLFKDVMTLQAPELIPFENTKLKEEFEKLTLQIAAPQS